jgi:hypothetical protein
MKIYNITGYAIIFCYMLACMYSAPTHLGPWTGTLIGGVYFYLLLVSWRVVFGRCSSFGNRSSFTAACLAGLSLPLHDGEGEKRGTLACGSLAGLKPAAT